MIVAKIDNNKNSEKWVWDDIALVCQSKVIYVNEVHISGGVPIISRTAEGTRYHESDYLGTTLWSNDMKGNLCRDYSDTTVFGEGSIQRDRSARFTGKPYDEDLQAFVFPYRNYNPVAARWMSVDPSGYPDGTNAHFYACNPTVEIDILGLAGVNLITDPGSNVSAQDRGAYGGGNVLTNPSDTTGFYVVVHGMGDGTVSSNRNETGTININDMANAIKNAPGYGDYDKIELISCGAGADGVAQQLANLLGKDVVAPDGTIMLYENGFYILLDGEWKTYKCEK